MFDEVCQGVASDEKEVWKSAKGGFGQDKRRRSSGPVSAIFSMT